MILLTGLALMLYAPTPLAILGAVLALCCMDFSKSTPPTERKLPAQEYEW